MLDKLDCVQLLNKLKSDKNIDTDLITDNYLKNPQQNLVETLTFLHKNNYLDISNFYQKVRKSYNGKKSNLYINIVNEENWTPNKVLTTLSSLQLQILLYQKNCVDKLLFLKHSRFKEISECLLNYANTFDLIPCQKLLKLVKADLKVLIDLVSN